MQRRKFMRNLSLGVSTVAFGINEIAAGQPSKYCPMDTPDKKRPNIVFIIADQHNAKFLSCKKHPDVKTPNLDRLALEGVRFDNAICQNPICTPSRVSFLSGQYCHNHGYYGLGGPNPKGLPTLFGHFKRNGYTTAAIGKIHCPANWVENDCDHFAEVYRGCSVGNKSSYDEYLKEKGLLDFRDDESYPEDPNRNQRQSLDGRVSGLQYKDCVEAWIARESIQYMAKAIKKENPFFIHVSFPRPHQIFSPSEPFWSMYEESKLTLPPNADYDMSLKAPHLRKTADSFKTGDWTLFEPRTFKAGRMRKLHGYTGAISQTDHAVGEVLSWLDEQGLAENTIVIYSADHGDYGCEHGIMEKAPGICSDAVTRIPFIWRWPGQFQAGHVAEELVESVDLSATLCALATLDPLETSDGKDLSPLLTGKAKKLRKIAVTENVWSKSIRKGKYRLVYYVNDMFPKEHFGEYAYDPNFGELYDLEADPWEMNNLYFDPNYQAVIAEIKQDYLDWLIKTTRPKTIWPPVHDEGDQTYTEFHSTVNHDGKINPSILNKRSKSNPKRNYL